MAPDIAPAVEPVCMNCGTKNVKLYPMDSAPAVRWCGECSGVDRLLPPTQEEMRKAVALKRVERWRYLSVRDRRWVTDILRRHIGDKAGDDFELAADLLDDLADGRLP